MLGGLLVAALLAVVVWQAYRIRSMRRGVDESESDISHSRAHIRSVIEGSLDAVFCQRDGHIEAANSVAVTLLAANSEADLLGRNIFDFVHPDYREAGKRRVREILDTHEPAPFMDAVFCRFDGTEVWVETSGRRIVVEGDVCTQVVVRDITERRRSTMLLQEAINSISEGFALYDADDRLVLFNKRYVDFYDKVADIFKAGTSYKKMLQVAAERGQFVDAVGREEEWVAERLRTHLNPEGPIEMELPDGRWVRITETKMPSGGVAGLRTDITEEKRAQIALRESEARLSGMLSISPDAIIACDRNHTITLFNEGAERLFGHSKEEALGQDVGMLIPPEYRGMHHEHMNAFGISTQSSITIPDRGGIFGLKKSGEVFPAEASVTKLETGDDLTFTVMLRDTTERQQVEGDLLSAREEAETANSAKSEFLANMSHELRTPLNAIAGFSQVLLGDIAGVLNEKQREYVSDVQESSQHLLSLINDILDISKIEAGQQEIHEEEFDISDELDSAVRMFKEKAETGGLELAITASPKLPAIKADRRLVHQMIINLLSNATKFTPPGGRIEVTAYEEENGGLAVAVRDTGVGMSETDIPVALSNFGQLKNQIDLAGEGTGLGLPLVRNMIELHGGQLDLTSQPGTGTSVTMEFPKDRVVRGT